MSLDHSERYTLLNESLAEQRKEQTQLHAGLVNQPFPEHYPAPTYAEMGRLLCNNNSLASSSVYWTLRPIFYFLDLF